MGPGSVLHDAAELEQQTGGGCGSIITVGYHRMLTHQSFKAATPVRVLFAVLGTTDDDFYGNLDRVTATSEEVRYLVQGVARVFPAVRHARIIGTYAGVLDKTVLVFGQMNEPPGARFRVAHTALTIAEHFRDAMGLNVLLLVDNVFRFVQAGMEVSGLLGNLSSQMGYQPTLATELAELQERIASTETASITSVQAVYVPADDFTDPAVVHTFGHLSASVVLSRERAAQGFYPAIDPLRSTSSLLGPTVMGERHYAVARAVRSTLAGYEDLKDIIAMLGLEELSEEDQNVVSRARRLERYLTQPFHVTEAFTGQPGHAVALEDALADCDRILSGELSDVPEGDFYMIGTLAEAGI